MYFSLSLSVSSTEPQWMIRHRQIYILDNLHGQTPKIGNGQPLCRKPPSELKVLKGKASERVKLLTVVQGKSFQLLFRKMPLVCARDWWFPYICSVRRRRFVVAQISWNSSIRPTVTYIRMYVDR